MVYMNLMYALTSQVDFLSLKAISKDYTPFCLCFSFWAVIVAVIAIIHYCYNSIYFRSLYYYRLGNVSYRISLNEQLALS